MLMASLVRLGELEYDWSDGGGAAPAPSSMETAKLLSACKSTELDADILDNPRVNTTSSGDDVRSRIAAHGAVEVVCRADGSMHMGTPGR